MNRFPIFPQVLPFLEFHRHGRQFLIRPQAAPDHPFILLPRIPARHLGWLLSATERFGRRHQRCLAFLLLVAPAARRWSLHLPPQCCGRHGSIWSPREIDPATLPSGFFIAGSYQSQHAEHPVPPFAGLHVLHQPSPSGSPQLQVVLRCGQAEPVVPDLADLVDDDQTSFLDLSRKRLHRV